MSGVVARMRPAARIGALFDPRGRLSRRAYGRFVVHLTLAAAGAFWLAMVLAAYGWRTAAFLAFALVPAGFAVNLVQSVRRLHDRGRTGWWAGLSLLLTLLSFVPVEEMGEAYPVLILAYTLGTLGLSLWLLVETLGRVGTPGPNRYGPVPPA